MNIEFDADKITYKIDSEDECYMIGFSDNGDEPDQYVIVQRSINFDEKDVEQGMNTYYFEYSDQANSGYGICKNVELRNNEVVFELADRKLNSITSIKISIENNTIQDWSEFRTIFNRIFLPN